MAADNLSLRSDIDTIYRNYEALKKFALQNGVSVPSELENL